MERTHQSLLNQFKSIKTIKIHFESGVVDVIVDEVNELNSYTDEKVAFSVVFKTDEKTIQEQGVYTLDIEGFDPMSIFMVPINRIDETSYYEVVFN